MKECCSPFCIIKFTKCFFEKLLSVSLKFPKIAKYSHSQVINPKNYSFIHSLILLFPNLHPPTSWGGICFLCFFLSELTNSSNHHPWQSAKRLRHSSTLPACQKRLGSQGLLGYFFGFLTSRRKNSLRSSLTSCAYFGVCSASTNGSDSRSPLRD